MSLAIVAGLLLVWRASRRPIVNVVAPQGPEGPKGSQGTSGPPGPAPILNQWYGVFTDSTTQVIN